MPIPKQRQDVQFTIKYHSDDQMEIFRHPAKRVIVRAGRRWGKTTGGKNRALDEVFRKDKPAKVLWVDTTQANIDRYVQELFLPDLKVLPPQFYKWRQQKKILSFANGAMIVFGSAERPENLEGFGYDLIILNEAGIILKERPKLWSNTIQPMTLDYDPQVLFIGTPKIGGFIYEEMSEKARGEEWRPGKHEWIEFHRTSYDNPMLSKLALEELEAEVPMEARQQEIYAEFVTTNAGYVVIPGLMAREAVERDVALSTGFRPRWGVDVAGTGGDKSTIAKRRANHLMEPVKVWDEPDTMRFAATIRDEFDETPVEDQPSEINVDANGLGKGVYDALRQWGLPARSIMVQETSSAKERYFRLRDELWFRARKWFEDRTCKIPEDKALIRELTTPLYDPNWGKGVIKVESKQDLKKRGSNSPDLADAFVLTFAGGPDRVDEGVMEKYRRKDVPDGSGRTWMSY